MWHGGMHGRGHVWQGHEWGACVAGGMHDRGLCMAGGMHGRGACIAGDVCGRGGACVAHIMCMQSYSAMDFTYKITSKCNIDLTYIAQNPAEVSSLFTFI